jgi:hypothetical protein
MIVLEFEAYYELKFGKTPKLVKKIDEGKKNSASFPKILTNGQKPSSSGNPSKIPPPKQGKSTNTSKSKDDQKSEKTDINSSFEGIQGNQMGKKEEAKEEDFFDARVLKAMPNYEDVPEFRDLANYL